MKPNNALKRDLLFQKKRDDMIKAKNINIALITNQNAPNTITDIASDNISNIVKVNDKLPFQSYDNYYENELKKGMNNTFKVNDKEVIEKLSKIIQYGFALKIVNGLKRLDEGKDLLLKLNNNFFEFREIILKYKSLTFEEFLVLLEKFLHNSGRHTHVKLPRE